MSTYHIRWPLYFKHSVGLVHRVNSVGGLEPGVQYFYDPGCVYPVKPERLADLILDPLTTRAGEHRYMFKLRGVALMVTEDQERRISQLPTDKKLAFLEELKRVRERREAQDSPASIT